MRPIRLTFSGLRSYRSEAVVNFADLELFAIVGDTGAGKSTIIEALSLALYATKTWQGGASKSEMIADGESVMRIELIFEADGHTWAVTRSWRRNGQGVNKLERIDKAEKVDGSTAVTERITQLLGLNHAQFTQAVVMPQGRFDKLLQATTSDRSRLLASILGLDAVRQVGTEAARLRDQWQPTVDVASARRAVLPLDPAAELADARAGQVGADARSSQLGVAVEALGSHQARSAALTVAADRLERSLAAVPASHRDLIGELEAARSIGARLGERRRALVAEQRELDATIEQLTETAAKTLAGFASRDDAVEARAAASSAAAGLRDDGAALDAAREALALVDATPPAPAVDDTLTSAVGAAAIAVAEARAQLVVAEAAVTVAARRWDELAAASTARATAIDARSVAHSELATARADAAAASVRREAAIVELTEAQRLEAEARTADSASAVASACRAGDACPVCRRALPEDFSPPPAGALQEALERSTVARAAVDADRDAASAASSNEDHAARNLARAEALVRETDAAVGAATVAAEAAGCTSSAPDRDVATARVRADRDGSAALLVVAERNHQQAAESLARATAEVAASVARHEAARATARSMVDEAERRVAAHQLVASRLPAEWAPPAPATAEALTQVVDDIATALDSLDAIDHERTSSDATRVRLATAIAEIEAEARHEVTRAADTALAALNDRLGRVREAVRAALDAPPPEPPGPAPLGSALVEPEALPPTARTADLPAIIAAAAHASAIADGALDAVRVTATRVGREHHHLSDELRTTLAEVGCDTLAQLHTEAGRAVEQATAAAVRADRAEEAVAAGERLDAFLAAARPFLANLEVLAVALRDRHFVGHLVKAREAELIAEANRRLRSITKERFGFVSDFGVVSVGSGEVRSPDALSGGERFQAALALALSLVEIASRGHGRLDAVFVDEGFGSLDASALDAALDTLGAVAGGGKMVGLISHLKPVAEYVETVMLVTKSDVLGSTISLLDPDGRERMLADDIRSGLTSG